MPIDFSPTPHEEALAFLRGKPVVSSDVFYALLPELRARVFTVSGVYGADVLQRLRDAIADLAGAPAGAPARTWDVIKEEIIAELEPYLGEGAEVRAETLLRVNSYQTFQASNWNVAQADDDTTHLQYLHGYAKVPTPEHEALHGLILPKNDPFWDTHYGPWGHFGCVCSARPMNEDLVADAREEDADKNPEDQRVLEGPALESLREGRLVRGPITTPEGEVLPARSYQLPAAPGPEDFQWQPGTLALDMESLKARYDPEVWNEFEARAKTMQLGDGRSVWDWLNE